MALPQDPAVELCTSVVYSVEHIELYAQGVLLDVVDNTAAGRVYISELIARLMAGETLELNNA